MGCIELGRTDLNRVDRNDKKNKPTHVAMNEQEMGNVGNGNIPGFGLQPAATNSVEEMLMRQRLGQEIPHFSNGPKRTESLYISPARKKEKVNFPWPIFHAQPHSLSLSPLPPPPPLNQIPTHSIHPSIPPLPLPLRGLQIDS